MSKHFDGAVSLRDMLDGGPAFVGELSSILSDEAEEANQVVLEQKAQATFRELRGR